MNKFPYPFINVNVRGNHRFNVLKKIKLNDRRNNWNRLVVYFMFKKFANERNNLQIL